MQIYYFIILKNNILLSDSMPNMEYLELLGVLMLVILEYLGHRKMKNTDIIAASTTILLMFKW